MQPLITSGHRSTLREGPRGGETRSYRTRQSRICPHPAAQDKSHCAGSAAGYIQSPEQEQTIIINTFVFSLMVWELILLIWCLILFKPLHNSLPSLPTFNFLCSWHYHYQGQWYAGIFTRQMIDDGLVPCANGCVSWGQSFGPWRCYSVGLDVPSTWVWASSCKRLVSTRKQRNRQGRLRL